MAAGDSYPANFSTPGPDDDPNSRVALDGFLNFTDDGDQPAGVNQPFTPAPDADVVILTDSGGDPLIDYDDSTGVTTFSGRVSFQTRVGFYGTAPIQKPSGDLAAALANLGLVTSPVLGASLTYVTVAAAAPTTFVTPIYVDSTAVTGATYAWNGSAYVKIGNILA